MLWKNKNFWDFLREKLDWDNAEIKEEKKEEIKDNKNKEEIKKEDKQEDL